MTLFALPNLVAQEVQILDGIPACKRPPFPDKEAYRAWCNDPGTEHAFVSLFEGVNPGLRISEVNPVCKVHGVVAEYDAQFHPDTGGMLWPPSFAIKTFSGNGRAVWLFSEAVPIDKYLWDAFRSVFFRAVRAANLAAGFQPLESRPEQYFELGTWFEAPGKPIPVTQVRTWLSDAALATKWKNRGVVLPIDLLREEASKRWPGRWPGGWDQFQLGERGTRFWDPSGDALSVIVTETGCVCFTGDQSFLSWSDIFGAHWVEKAKGMEIAKAIEGLYYDEGTGSFFRSWTPESPAKPISREDLKLELRARGLDPKPPKGSLMSEQDVAMRTIQQYQSADVVAPMIFRPMGVVEYGGLRFLNTSRVRPFLPAPDSCPWGDKFPWIARFFDNAFRDQLPRFQAWWAHFYQGALVGEPGTGLALAVAGSNNAGKNFFTNAILGQAIGGHKDASRYVTGEDGFNAQLVAAPLWTLHDAIVTGDNRRYSQRLKAIVANREVLARGMFREGVDVPWQGRVVITMNVDPESLRMLPDMELTIRDKIMLLKIEDAESRVFPTDADIREELPYFCAWARDHLVPEEIAHARFGVCAWHHPDLLAAAMAESPTQSTQEILEAWREEWFEVNPNDHEWRGTTTQLLTRLTSSAAVGTVAAKTFRNPESLGRNVRKVARLVNWVEVENSHRKRTIVRKK